MDNWVKNGETFLNLKNVTCINQNDETSVTIILNSGDSFVIDFNNEEELYFFIKEVIKKLGVEDAVSSRKQSRCY